MLVCNQQLGKNAPYFEVRHYLNYSLYEEHHGQDSLAEIYFWTKKHAIDIICLLDVFFAILVFCSFELNFGYNF